MQSMCTPHRLNVTKQSLSIVMSTRRAIDLPPRNEEESKTPFSPMP